VLAGYPVVDLHVDILDGAAHAKDSSDEAFRLAAVAAIREAARRAKPLLIEPVMKVEVDAPGEEQGDLPVISRSADYGGPPRSNHSWTLSLTNPLPMEFFRLHSP